jgi:MFS superfamily sulfate permease-like transporter
MLGYLQGGRISSDRGNLYGIIGGILVSLFMGARTTIKGPAAGPIAIAVGAVEELGKGDNIKGYQLSLAVIIVAAVLQILFGVFRVGKL